MLYNIYDTRSTTGKSRPQETNKRNAPRPSPAVGFGNLIRGKSVSFAFEGPQTVVAVNGVDFDIPEGKVTGLVGESGSGKTTLIKLIYGLLEPATGEVRYRNRPVPTGKDKLIPGHDAMKLVSQGFEELNLYAKVQDNVASQLSNTDLALKTSKTHEVLEKLKIAHLADQRVADLSGGEKQRVAIARALANDPEVLLMDEPFNQVDASFRDGLRRDIQAIVAEGGLTVVLVSHDLSDVLAMADKLIVMKSARIMEQGTPEQLYQAPRRAYTARLLAKSNILDARQAASMGIALPTGLSIAIHQEDVLFSESPAGRFHVQDILFMGFYREVVLTDGHLTLHAIGYPPVRIGKGDRVDVTARKFIALISERKLG